MSKHTAELIYVFLAMMAIVVLAMPVTFDNLSYTSLTLAWISACMLAIPAVIMRNMSMADDTVPMKDHQLTDEALQRFRQHMIDKGWSDK